MYIYISGVSLTLTLSVCAVHVVLVSVFLVLKTILFNGVAPSALLQSAMKQQTASNSIQYLQNGVSIGMADVKHYL